MCPQNRIKVFISYAHLSDNGYMKAVADLVVYLSSKDNLEVISDHLHQIRPPKEGWQTWMLKSVEDSEVVLIICTQAYKDRFEKR